MMAMTEESNTRNTLTGIDSVDRANQLDSWDHERARQLAKKEGLALSDEHFVVLDFLRNYYVENDWPERTHELAQLLDDQFEQQGGKQYLFKLFPEGALAQATRLAGLPIPSNVASGSFGSTY